MYSHPKFASKAAAFTVEKSSLVSLVCPPCVQFTKEGLITIAVLYLAKLLCLNRHTNVAFGSLKRTQS